MDKKPLISVITPCHNSALFIHRLLDSVLEQTYPNVEMIMVDNDSKDNTAEIIKSYIPKFVNRGYSLSYIWEEDLGPSTGIQTGLRVIKGDYLLMPDSDDFYNTKYAFEKWVSKFQELGDDYAIIRCQLQFINEEDMSKGTIVYKNFPADDPGTLFEDCLYGQNGYNFAPIGYMVRVSQLRELTGLEIFNAYNTGQQRQICMPLYYKYKAYTLLEPLVCYLVRKSSISHGDYAKYPTQFKLYNQAPQYIDSILKSCKGITENEFKRYRSDYLKMRALAMLEMAVSIKKDSDYIIYINDYEKNGGKRAYIEKQLILFKRQFLLKKIFSPSLYYYISKIIRKIF